MIHRVQLGRVPPKPHTVFEPDGAMAFEHCFTRQGFSGAYTILYHRRPPHWNVAVEDLGTHPGWAATSWDGPLRRRHVRASAVDEGPSPFLARRLLMANKDLGVWMAHATASEPTLVANGGADELSFVHRGSGAVHSPLGVLRFGPGDYVYVPRSMPHRWVLDGPSLILTLEGRSWIDVPEQFRNASGQLRMDAPYTHRDFRFPEWPQGGPETLGAPRRLVVQMGDKLTAMTPEHDPFDCLGWDGYVWPFAFPIRAYQAKAGLVHLPPTIHTTFAGGGFIVCSFVPRIVDFHEKAIPCPYPHSSVHCDEIIDYVEGRFTSRKGVGPGSISLHPAGMPHGPHPGTYEASVGTRWTDELAVMVDTFAPLHLTDHARAIEDADYERSWVK